MASEIDSQRPLRRPFRPDAFLLASVFSPLFQRPLNVVFLPLFFSSRALIEILKRTLACACVFTMRLGATFLRLKELVEPAVDLAKEMDCIEAAIFDVICVSVFMRLRRWIRALLFYYPFFWLWGWILRNI